MALQVLSQIVCINNAIVILLWSEQLKLISPIFIQISFVIMEVVIDSILHRNVLLDFFQLKYYALWQLKLSEKPRWFDLFHLHREDNAQWAKFGHQVDMMSCDIT